jgi:predicted nucleic acid-binding protein
VALALVDSSALVAYIVEGDTLHRSATEAIESALRGGQGLAVSAVTWTEVLRGALLGYFAEPEVYELAVDFGITVLAVDEAVAQRAAELQIAYRGTRSRAPWPTLRTPDALILATAETYDEVEAVIAGDTQWANVPGVATDLVLLRERG